MSGSFFFLFQIKCGTFFINYYIRICIERIQFRGKNIPFINSVVPKLGEQSVYISTVLPDFQEKILLKRAVE